jgi:K+-transporting ATPase KdpF subunit
MTVIFIGNAGALGERYVGHNIFGRNRSVLCSGPRICTGVRKTMSTWEVAMGLVMAVGLTVYLVYALLRPEKF